MNDFNYEKCDIWTSYPSNHGKPYLLIIWSHANDMALSKAIEHRWNIQFLDKKDGIPFCFEGNCIFRYEKDDICGNVLIPVLLLKERF